MNPRSATVEASGSRRRPNRWDQFRSVEGEAHSSTGALVGPAADPRAEYRNPFVPLPSLSRRMGSNENDILIHRDHEEYRDGSPYMRLSAPICQPNIQMIWNANSTQDMTVNFELDIEPDIESCMEDFRQLVSFGRFKSAEECFEENLLDHVQEPIVTLGLAEMLLQQGAYGRLIDLCQDHSTRKSKGLPAWECETDLLSIVRERCISMIFWIGRFSCLGGYESSHHFMPEFKSHLKFLMSRLDPSVNDTSTAHLEEVRLASYCFQAIGILGCQANCLEDREVANLVDGYLSTIKMSQIYSESRRLERIEEAQTVFLALLSTVGAERTWISLFEVEIYEPGAILLLINTWTETEKEARFALFGMLVAVARQLIAVLRSDYGKVPLSGVNQSIIKVVRECLNRAKVLATSMLEEDPAVVQTRSYLGWILAQEELPSLTSVDQQRPWIESRVEHAADFPGVKIFLGLNPLSVYAPRGVENPGFQSSKIPESSQTMLYTALRASQQLGDYRMEADILRELICHSSSPAALFADLKSLQKNVQEDAIGGLQTALSKYAFISDRASLKELKSELAVFDSLQASGYLSNSHVLVWCQRTVQMALNQLLDMPVEAETSRSHAKNCARTLPMKLQTFISRTDFSDNKGRVSKLEFFGFFGDGWRKYNCDLNNSSEPDKNDTPRSSQERPMQPKANGGKRDQSAPRQQDSPPIIRFQTPPEFVRSLSASPPISTKVTFSDNVQGRHGLQPGERSLFSSQYS